MTEIPESVMEEALEVARCVILDEDQTPEYLGFVSRNLGKAILAAEKRGEERERERCVERAMRKTKELDIRSAFDRGYRAGRMAAATDIRLMTAAIRKGSD